MAAISFGNPRQPMPTLEEVMKRIRALIWERELPLKAAVDAAIAELLSSRRNAHTFTWFIMNASTSEPFGSYFKNGSPRTLADMVEQIVREGLVLEYPRWRERQDRAR